MILPPPYFDHDDVPEGPIGPRDVGYRLRALDELLGEDLPRPRNEVETDLGIPSGDVSQADPFEPSPGGGFSADYLPWMTEGGRLEGATVSSREGESLFSSAAGVWRGVGDAHEVVPQLLPGNESENMPPTTESHDFGARLVSPDVKSCDSSEKQHDTEQNEDIVPLPVPSRSTSTPSNYYNSSTPQSLVPPQDLGFDVVGNALTPSLKYRFRRQKRPRSDDDDSDDDGDDSGYYCAPIHRPFKTARRILSAPRLDCETASSCTESEASSSSGSPGRHNEGGMSEHRVCEEPELTCGFPGCPKILKESDLKEARTHYRSHFRGKDGEWAGKTKVTCNWSGCIKPFTLDLMQCQRHLQEHHFRIRYECPKCKKRVVRSTYLKTKHIPKCLARQSVLGGGTKVTSKRGQAGKKGRARSRRNN